jgi:uncharacterized Zn finger protein
MEVTVDLDEDYETDIEIDFSYFSDEDKKKIIKAIKQNKKFLFKDVSVKITGEFTQDIEYEPMYNEGYY